MAAGFAAAAGALTSAFGQSRANAQNRQEARKNRTWQKMMSDTAIRRRMIDMKAGGINPLLAARHEASTPGGSQSAAMKNVLEGAPAAATAAANLALIKANTELTQNKADAIKPGAEIGETLGKGINTGKQAIGGIEGAFNKAGVWIGETAAKGVIGAKQGAENFKFQRERSSMENNLSDLADRLASLNKKKSQLLKQDIPLPDWLVKELRDTKLAITQQQQDLRSHKK